MLFETFKPDGSKTKSPDIYENADQLRSWYEDAVDRELLPSDPEYILIQIAAYAYTVTQLSINEVGKQNLLEYASGEALDLLAVPFGVNRLGGSPARTTLSFSGLNGVFIPEGTRVRTSDGNFIFATSSGGEISGGNFTVAAIATALGDGGNGYAPGAITTLIDVLPGVSSVTNSETSSGGTPIETDRQLRQRIPRALDRLSPGTRDGYRAMALDFDPSIIGVSAVGPFERIQSSDPPRYGEVDLFILTSDGIPSLALLEDLEDFLYSDGSSRIVGDLVTVLSPTVVSLEVEISLSVDPNVPLPDILDSVNANVSELVNDWRSQLGANILDSRLICAALSSTGVTDASIAFSVGSSGQLSPSEWGDIVYSVNVVS